MTFLDNEIGISEKAAIQKAVSCIHFTIHFRANLLFYTSTKKNLNYYSADIGVK